MTKTAQDIILKPVITEASMEDLRAGRYTFRVALNANKIEIKDAVEEIFGVKVDSVHTMRVRGRRRRMGRNEGTTPAWKKGIVTLAEGSKTIAFFDGMIYACSRGTPPRAALSRRCTFRQQAASSAL